MTTSKIKRIMVRVLTITFVFALLLAALSLTATMTAAAKQDPPSTRRIPLGCICVEYGFGWDCCDDAYWHPEQGGWLECQGDWHFEWWLPHGCDSY